MVWWSAKETLINLKFGRPVKLKHWIWLRRALQPEEQAALSDALEQGFTVFHAGSAETRRQLLAASVVVALANAGAAQLWACCLEAYDASEVEDVATLVAAIGAKCDTVSSALLGADLGV